MTRQASGRDQLAIRPATAQTLQDFSWQILWQPEDLAGMEIQAGVLLECETADGTYAVMCALGPPEQGRDFRVVWVCKPEEYESAGTLPEGIPWPYSAVRVLEQAHGTEGSAVSPPLLRRLA
jgi:hypothetical protein